MSTATPAPHLSDRELLRRYAYKSDEAAFTTLGRRYERLVYTTCLREIGAADLAADAAQETFLLLARSARSLSRSRHANLAGWCFTAARNVARNARRAEKRRRTWEEEVAVAWENEREQEANAVWESLEPRLNEMLSGLRPPDRDALLLRYFEQKSLAEVGADLGVSENAAQMRVSRALVRLRERLKATGIVAPVTLIAVLLDQRASVAAPPDFSDRLAAVVREARGAKSVPTARLSPVLNPALYIAAVLMSAALAGGIAWRQRPAPGDAPQGDLPRLIALQTFLDGDWEGTSADQADKKTPLRLRVRRSPDGTYLIHRYDYPATGGSGQIRWIVEKRTGRLVADGHDVFRMGQRGETLTLEGWERRNTGTEILWRFVRQQWRRSGDRLIVTFEADSPPRTERILRLKKR